MRLPCCLVIQDNPINVPTVTVALNKINFDILTVDIRR